jgi:hypothetical protein
LVELADGPAHSDMGTAASMNTITTPADTQ